MLVASSAFAEPFTSDSLAELEERVRDAFIAAERALASEEARLRDLAIRQSTQKLADGQPSVAQAAANVWLWEQRIGELRRVEDELRRQLNDLLAELAPSIGELVQRLAEGPGLDSGAGAGPESIERSGGVPSAESSSGSVGGDAPARAYRDSHAAVELSLALDRSSRAVVQMGLTSLGFDTGPADGLFGNRTRSAIRSWQSASDYEATGYLTPLQAGLLMAAGRDVKQKQAAENKRREQQRLAQKREEQLRAKRERAAEKAMQEQQRQGRQTEIEPTPADQRAIGRAAREVFRDCSDCPEMVAVPAGSFRMGGPSGETGRQDNEGPQHWVEIDQPFAMSVYEITREEYLRFLIAEKRTWADTCITFEGGEIGERGDRNWQNPGFHQTDRHPVVCVSWDDAQAYVRWLSLQAGQAYRLLSESEWEYAARAGTATARYWGDGESEQCRHANGLDSSTDLVGRSGRVGCHDGYAATSPAGTFSKNPFGVYDVLGNVWEWTADCWAEDYGAVSGGGRPRRIGGCESRVIRGGSWINGPTFLRSARRDRIPADHRFNVVGFRVGRSFE